MIINSSAVGMAAKTMQRTKYTETNQSVSANLQGGGLVGGGLTGGSFTMSYERAWSGSQVQSGGKNPVQSRQRQELAYPDYGGNRVYRNRSVQNNKRQEQSFMLQLRNFLFGFRNQLSMMLGQRSFFGGMMDLSSGTGSVSVWKKVDYQSYTYEEEEKMSFETVGKALTADGREIEFNMQLEMSREYTESVETLSETTVIMTDPLVISLNSNPVSVSDQKWKFDIDGDGKRDSISQLSRGAGYLAYDKNGDGVINDGTELFGAATGNGFAELSVHDEDGNGWIDENDSIYDKLSVWIKDDSGQDKLINLREANVGAIYLGSVSTEFSLKSQEDNQHNAQIRRSGMYLTEDGRANVIQQLDMVKEA